MEINTSENKGVSSVRLGKRKRDPLSLNKSGMPIGSIRQYLLFPKLEEQEQAPEFVEDGNSVCLIHIDDGEQQVQQTERVQNRPIEVIDLTNDEAISWNTDRPCEHNSAVQVDVVNNYNHQRRVCEEQVVNNSVPIGNGALDSNNENEHPRRSDSEVSEGNRSLTLEIESRVASPLRATTNFVCTPGSQEQREKAICLLQTDEIIEISSSEDSENQVPHSSLPFKIKDFYTMAKPSGNSTGMEKNQSKNPLDTVSQGEVIYINGDIADGSRTASDADLLVSADAPAFVPNENLLTLNHLNVVQKNSVEEKIEHHMKNKQYTKACDGIVQQLNEENDAKMPTVSHLALLTTKVLNYNATERVAKDVKKATVEIWKTLIKKAFPIKHLRTLCIDVFTKILIIKKIELPDWPRGPGPWGFILILCKDVLDEAVVDPSEKLSLQLLDVIIELLEYDYDCYGGQKHKKPLILELLHSKKDAAVLHYSKYIENLLEKMFEFYEFEKPFYSILKWVRLLFAFFRKNNKEIAHQLSMSFCTLLKDSKYEPYKVHIIKNLKDNDLGESICFNLLKDLVYFDQNGPKPPNNEGDIGNSLELRQRQFLLKFSEPIRQGIVYEKLFSVEESPIHESNNYGECDLHVFIKQNKVQQLKSRLLNIRQCKRGNVNLMDNYKNTPLHDAAATKSKELVPILYEHSLFVFEGESIPNNLAVNLLAKNKTGATPLHLVTSYPAAELLLYLAEKFEISQSCLMTTNNQGKRPCDVIPINGDDESKRLRKLLTPKIQCLDTLWPSSRSEITNNQWFMEVVYWWNVYSGQPSSPSA